MHVAIHIHTQERIAIAYFAEVREAIGWSTDGMPLSPPLAVLRASYNECAGGLLLTHFELLWIKAGSHFSEAQLRMPLRQIERTSASLSKSPFGSQAELLVAMRGEQAPMHFTCGSAVADVELFSLELATTVAAIPGTAPVTTAAAADLPTPAATAPARRQTKQCLAAADLRAKLKQVVASTPPPQPPKSSFRAAMVTTANTWSSLTITVSHSPSRLLCAWLSAMRLTGLLRLLSPLLMPL